MLKHLLLCLLITTLGAQADDLDQHAPPAAIALILEQLENNSQPYFAVIDYARHSSQPRLMILRRSDYTLIASYRVAHGKGSDANHDGYAERFSDEPSSLASSLGIFRTGSVYQSRAPGHGLSMRLQGLSESNRNAEQRDIVLHGNRYMEKDFIERHGVAGRSHGCLVLADRDRDAAVQALEGGALIFALDSRQKQQRYLAPSSNSPRVTKKP